MRSKQPPGYEQCYVLHRPEADELVAALAANGYRAKVDYTGGCHTDDNGEHWHPDAVVVTLTPEQARTLAARRTR